MTRDAPIEITYLRERTWYPRKGLHSRLGDTRRIPTRAAATLRTASGSDAPIAAVLSTAQGPHVTVRNLDGRLLRPVRRPDSWDPCTIGDFAAASHDGPSWTDSPFVPDGIPLANHATPVAATDEGRWAEDGRDEALAQALARLSELVVVDGVVHQPMDAPSLSLRTHGYGAHDGMSLDWGDRLGCDGSWTFAGVATSRRDKWLDTVYVREGTPGHAGMHYDLDREDDAHAVGEEWARRRGAPYDRRRIVVDLVPSLIPPRDTVDVVVRMAAELAETFHGADWGMIHKAPREVVERWLDLREAATRAAADPDADRIRDAFERLDRLMPEIVGPDGTNVMAPNRLAVRWRHAERHRDLTMVPGLGDGWMADLPRF